MGHCGGDGSALFRGIPSSSEEEKKGQENAPNPFRVVRYHSLAVEEGTLPSCLRATAWTVGGTVAVETGASEKAAAKAANAKAAAASVLVSPSLSSTPEQKQQEGEKEEDETARRVLMALEHSSLPLFGVQFHPESVATSYGDALFANFKEIVLKERRIRLGIDEEDGKEEEGAEEEAGDDGDGGGDDDDESQHRRFVAAAAATGNRWLQLGVAKLRPQLTSCSMHAREDEHEEEERSRARAAAAAAATPAI